MFDKPPPSYHERSIHQYQSDSDESSSVEVVARGIANYGGSCWMDCVIQALRASPSFRTLFAPSFEEKSSSLRSELFRLFSIIEGQSGYAKRDLKNQETKSFRKLVVEEGLPVGMHGGYLEIPFMNFLLKKLNIPKIEYHYSAKKRVSKERLLTVPVAESKQPKKLQNLIKNRKIAFESSHKTPQFLPLHLDRPGLLKKGKNGSKFEELSRVSVIPTSTLEINVGKNKKARYQLVSIVIGRDSKNHAYTYCINHDIQGNELWVEYNDLEVVIHPKPYTDKRRSKSRLTPFEDACKHGGLFIYEFAGYVT